MSLSEGKMSTFEEKWVTLYRTALVELEHAKMSGRIESARSEIAARVEKLRTMPGLYTDERQAIADALSALRALELEESRYGADHSRLVLDNASTTSRIAPAALKKQNEETSD
jgi:hypothetical protein